MIFSEEDLRPWTDVTIREKEGPGSDDKDTEEEPVDIPLLQKGHGLNNATRWHKNDIHSTLDSQWLHLHLHERKRATNNHILQLVKLEVTMVVIVQCEWGAVNGF